MTKVKVAQLCLTLCDPMDHTVHGILQEWVASGIERRSPLLQADSLPAKSEGKPL